MNSMSEKVTNFIEDVAYDASRAARGLKEVAPGLLMAAAFIMANNGVQDCPFGGKPEKHQGTPEYACEIEIPRLLTLRYPSF